MPNSVEQTLILDCLDERGDISAHILLDALPRRSEDSSKSINLLEVLSEEDAIIAGESEIQLRENGRYRCRIKDATSLSRKLTLAPNPLIKAFGAAESSDLLIETRSSAGRLVLKVIDKADETNAPPVARGSVEIRSIKLHYREEFRGMLKSIADEARDFLFQLGASTEFTLQSAWSSDPPTIVQQIEFMRSLFHGGGLWRPIERILRMPHERLESEPEQRPPSRVGRGGAEVARQLASGQPRVPLPEGHKLYDQLKGTVPRHINVHSRRRITDTPENRFVKHMLGDFTKFLKHAIEILEAEDSKQKAETYRPVINDCKGMKMALDRRLQNSFFRQLSAPRVPPMGSPVLQRKPGYREVFQTWLAFKMSARLQWEGSEDVFGGSDTGFDAGKKDLPTLYEAWLFFKLLGVFTDIFGLNYEDARDFFTSNGGPLGKFTLRQGTMRKIGSAKKHGLKMQALFRYNHSFSGKGKNRSQESSWTRVLRPDYTISVWPENMTQGEAEATDEMVHIHFDAKYRVDKIEKLFGDIEEEEDDERERRQTREKREETEGNYNRADLLKMHAYRDAIRRSEGAYVLYPGNTSDKNANKRWQGFHELLPGLGAFAVRPDETGEAKGIDAVRTFLKDAVAQLANRSSRLAHSRYHQREETDRKIGDPQKDQAQLIELTNRIIRDLRGNEPSQIVPAQEIIVLSGIVKDTAHLKWIEETQCYNFRSDRSGSGFLPVLAPNYPRAEAIVLRDADGKILPGIWRVEGIEEWGAEELKDAAYPSEPSHKNYTIFRITRIESASDLEWDGDVFKDIQSVARGKTQKRISEGNISTNCPFEINLKQLMGATSNHSQNGE